MLFNLATFHALRVRTREAIKNIGCGKDEGVIDYDSVTKYLKRFRSVSKNVDDQQI